MEASEPSGADIYLEDYTAGAYLTQARQALLACGKPAELYPNYREDPEARRLEKGRLEAHVQAQSRQLERARTSVLFAALSAEAYVNAFLWDKLAGSDYEAVEKLGTTDKFVIGPKLALAQTLFDRGSEPLQSIAALFRLRHDLVHPKSKPIRITGTTLMDERFDRFNPAAAARFIVSVAEAAAILADASEKRRNSIITTILDRKADHLAFGDALRSGLPAPPKKLGPLNLGRIGSVDTARPVVEPQAARALPDMTRLRRDPLHAPTTVPQSVDLLLNVLAPLPGTATAPMPPQSQ